MGMQNAEYFREAQALHRVGLKALLLRIEHELQALREEIRTSVRADRPAKQRREQQQQQDVRR
jgi:hypothetical protein